MSIRAHCPSCQAEYTLVDSLRGKYVRCERCRRAFRAMPVRLEPTDQTLPPTDLPPLQLTQPWQGGPPLTIVTSGEQAAEAAPEPPRRPNSAKVNWPSTHQERKDKGGAGCAGYPIGIALAVGFVLLRACSSLPSSSTNDSSRWKTPSPAPIKLPDNIEFRLVKEKGLLGMPKEQKDAMPVENVPKLRPVKDKDVGVGPGGK